jgi:VWFA-related protein
MRWLLAIACLSAAQPQPTFRSSVRLIVQPVTVKDRAGKPIEGLTAKDFVVTEDGRPQEIVFAEFQRLDGSGTPQPAPAAPAPAVPAAARGTVTVPVPGDGRYRGRRLLILYFDLYRMPVSDQFRAFASAGQYVSSSMTPADLVAIVSFKGRGVRRLQEFTADRDALRERLQALAREADDETGALAVTWDPGGAFGEDDDTFNLFSADRQLSALQTVATDLGAIPELKTLIYFGAGLRMSGTENLAQLRATMNAAIRANVTINPVDTRGLAATAPLGDATRPSPGGIGMFNGVMIQNATTRFQQSQDTLYALAKDTGGKALLDTNDLSQGIVQAAQAVTGYYLLGYYSTSTAADGKYRRVKVALAGTLAAELSYRPGYYGNKVFEKFNAAEKERHLADALRLEDPITEIPMAIEVNYFQLNGAEYFVPVSVRMPGSELTRARQGGASRVAFEIIGELKDEFGVTHRNVRDRIEIPPTGRSVQYETAFTVLPGTYVIKVLARNDTTGRIGTFQTSFVVPNLAREQRTLPTSSVVLATQRVPSSSALFTVKQKVSADVAHPLVWDGRRLVPSVTRTFSARRPLYVFLEAYGTGSPGVRTLVAFVGFYRDGVKVFQTEPQGVGESSGAAAVPIRLQIPLDSLTPGRYDCQVTVLDPSIGRAAFWRTPIAVVR